MAFGLNDFPPDFPESANKFRHCRVTGRATCKASLYTRSVTFRVILACLHLPCESFNLDTDNGFNQAAGDSDGASSKDHGSSLLDDRQGEVLLHKEVIARELASNP